MTTTEGTKMVKLVTPGGVIVELNVANPVAELARIRGEIASQNWRGDIRPLLTAEKFLARKVVR